MLLEFEDAVFGIPRYVRENSRFAFFHVAFQVQCFQNEYRTCVIIKSRILHCNKFASSLYKKYLTETF